MNLNFGSLEEVSTTIQKRRIALYGHVFRDESSPVQQLIAWVLRHGRAESGSLTTAHRNTLMRDTGVENVRDPESCMRDRALCIWGQFSSCCLLGVDRK